MVLLCVVLFALLVLFNSTLMLHLPSLYPHKSQLLTPKIWETRDQPGPPGPPARRVVERAWVRGWYARILESVIFALFESRATFAKSADHAILLSGMLIPGSAHAWMISCAGVARAICQ